jgi:hypothetical protein
MGSLNQSAKRGKSFFFVKTSVTSTPPSRSLTTRAIGKIKNFGPSAPTMKSAQRASGRAFDLQIRVRLVTVIELTCSATKPSSTAFGR